MFSKTLFPTLAAAALAVAAPAFGAPHAAPDRATADCSTAPPCCSHMAQMHGSDSERSDDRSAAAAGDTSVAGVGQDRSLDFGG